MQNIDLIFLDVILFHLVFKFRYNTLRHSHLSNKRGGWNKHGGGAKVAKSINVEVGINVDGAIFWKKLVHKCNKRGADVEKI